MEQPDQIPSEHAYRVILKVVLDRAWEEWFEGMQIEVEGGNTVLAGSVADQAALHGLLKRIHDLHLTLRSVEMLS